MNREDIIRIAREAGFEELFKDSHDWVCFTDEIERFAALISSRVAAAAKAEEREECAKVLEETPFSNWFKSDCAAAIRARGINE